MRELVGPHFPKNAFKQLFDFSDVVHGSHLKNPLGPKNGKVFCGVFSDPAFHIPI